MNEQKTAGMGKFREFIEEQDAIMSEEYFSRFGFHATANERCGAWLALKGLGVPISPLVRFSGDAGDHAASSA